MKILILSGSYRRSGNTDQVLQLIQHHLQQEAAQHQVVLEIESLYLGQQDLQFCRGCRICFDRGEEHCPLKDNLLPIKAQMLAADGILLGSPVYVDDVSALVKNWIDRLSHVCHRPQFAGKVTYLVATTGDSRTSKTLETMSLALRTWGFHVLGQSGFKMGARMKPEVTRQRYEAQAAAIARQLFRAIDQKSFTRPTFFSLMMFKIQQMSWKSEGDPATVDYRYWDQQGWLDPGRSFFISHRSGWLKVALARLTGVVINRLMN